MNCFFPFGKSAKPFKNRLGESEAMAKKINRVQVILECTETKNDPEVKGVSRYYTIKNKKNTTGRIELRKYNKFAGRHTLHRETK